MLWRRRVLVMVAGVAAVCAAAPLAASAASSGAVPAAGAVRAAGLWGRAVVVPGLEVLNRGQLAQVSSVSCASPGNCAAGGFYRDHGQQGFVVSERNGRWGQAVEVPGLGALNKGGNADVESVSCPSAGNCAVGGSYRDDRGRRQGFVVSERSGRWGKVAEIPGLAALNKGGHARVVSVSCGSPGNCAAGGYYTDGSIEADSQGFMAAEQGGRWGRAVEVSGLAKGNFYTEVASVACTRAGPCVAGGFAFGNTQQGFVVSERNGRWGPVIKVLAPKAPANSAAIFSVSCASPGNCAAGGDYQDKDFYNYGMVVAEKNGHWAHGIKVPGLAALTYGQDAGFVNSVSCPTWGTCAAGGAYPRAGRQQAFVTQNGRA